MAKCTKTYPIRLTRHEANTLRLAIVAYKEQLAKRTRACPGGSPTATISSEVVDLTELEQAYNTQLGVKLA